MQETYLEPSQISMVELPFENHKKVFDVLLGSKYTSGIGFAVEKVYKMSIFIWHSQSSLQKFAIAFLFLELIKNMLV